MARIVWRRGLVLCVTAVALLAIGRCTAASAADVRLGSLRASVPAGWQQVRLAAHPQRCVLLDRRVVYLGRQRTEARCPARRIGATRAIHVERLRPSIERGMRFEKRPERVAGVRVWRSADPRGSGRLTVVAPALGVALTLPYGTSPKLSERIIRSIRRAGPLRAGGRRELPPRGPRRSK